MTVQNLMFPKEDGWDMTSAKAWLAEHPDIKKAFDGWVECAACHEVFNYLAIAEIAMGAVACPACMAILDQKGKVLQAAGTKDFVDAFKALVESNKNLVEQLTSMEMQIKKYVEAMQHALDVHSDPEKFGGTAGDSEKVLAEINQLLKKP
jgi:hypothetical protein